MTKPNFTSINVIMDASGSMSSLRSDTIGGFNSFIEEQKKAAGEAIVSLCTFNSSYHHVYENKSLNDVAPLTVEDYYPAGSTALLDCMGYTINSVGAQLAALKEEERPSKVIVLILTDGQENSSREFTKDQIKDMVTHQSEKYNWDFVFIGANMDAIEEGHGIGVANSFNYSATPEGTHNLYKSLSRSVTKYRMMPDTDIKSVFNLDDSDNK
jgi:hypothetical protein